MKISPVHAALRAATSSRHERLEVDADLAARLRDPARRAGAVAGLLSFHRQVLVVTAPWMQALGTTGVSPADRVDQLQRGAAVLSVPPPAPGAPAPDVAPDLGAALGWLYVSEGSSLGGRVMRKAMIRDGIDLAGLDFLDPHGGETGPRWSAFMTVLDEAVTEARASQPTVIAAAVVAFDHARAALIPSLKTSRAA